MKKISAILLSAILLAASTPLDSLAASQAAVVKTADAVVTNGNASATADQKLEQALLAVKAKITIPEEYSRFDYYYSDSNAYAQPYWGFTWRNPSTGSYIMVNCDVNNNITMYNKYDYSVKNTGIAKYLKSELKTTAEDFIKNINPEVASSLDYLGADYEGTYSGNYVYRYQRINNGVEFPDNTVTVGVNSVTGTVTSATINWLYDVTIPAADKKISKEDATKIIKDNMKMKLVYRTNYYWLYSDSSTVNKKAYLVYEPSVNYISVDAKTGKVYNTNTDWIETTNGETATDSTSKDSSFVGSTVVTLTDAEIAKIKELQKIITKADAIKKVTSNKALYLDKNLTSYSATLQKSEDVNGVSSYIWNISLNDPRPVDYKKNTDTYRGYANATVDAKTGKLLSFYASLKSNYDTVNQKWKTVKVKYTKEQSRKLLETFLKAQIKNRFTNSILINENEDYIAYYKGENPIYGGYSYQYNRVHEGVEYPYNSINGAVDGVTGKIYSYGSYWDNNVTFESTKGVMSADKALDYYLSNEGYGLKYEINVINKYNVADTKTEVLTEATDSYSVDYEVRLVYRPDVNPYYISPFTGEQMNYNGEVYKVKTPYTYKDIDNSQANKNILLLADMNIGFEGGNFLPNQNITVDEIKKILNDVGYGYQGSGDAQADTRNITREQLAQMFINYLGMEKMSKISGIYKTGYADENSIDSQYLGAVALTKGLGIIGGDSSNNFNPKQNITRFDAVNLIMNFITALQQVNNY